MRILAGLSRWRITTHDVTPAAAPGEPLNVTTLYGYEDQDVPFSAIGVQRVPVGVEYGFEVWTMDVPRLCAGLLRPTLDPESDEAKLLVEQLGVLAAGGVLGGGRVTRRRSGAAS